MSEAVLDHWVQATLNSNSLVITGNATIYKLTKEKGCNMAYNTMWAIEQHSATSALFSSSIWTLALPLKNMVMWKIRLESKMMFSDCQYAFWKVISYLDLPEALCVFGKF